MKNIILLIGAFFLGVTLHAQDQEVIIPFADQAASKSLRVDIFSGTIKIIGTDRTDILLRYSEQSSMNDCAMDTGHGENDKSKGLKKIGGQNFNLEISSEKNVASIISQSWTNNLSLNMEVPKNIKLDISKNIGEWVEIENISGNVNIENNVGDITAKGITGIVNASTNAGSILVVINDIPEAKSMLFHSTTGEIDLTLPRVMKANLKLHTQMGEIFGDLDLEIQESPDQNKKGSNKNGNFKYCTDPATYATLNGGGVDITMRTTMGNLYLRGQ